MPMEGQDNSLIPKEVQDRIDEYERRLKEELMAANFQVGNLSEDGSKAKVPDWNTPTPNFLEEVERLKQKAEEVAQIRRAAQGPSHTIFNNRSTGATKTDKGKKKWSLGLLNLFAPVVNIFHDAMGREDANYKPFNWRGLTPESLQSAYMRHLEAHDEGLMRMWEEELIDNDYVLTQKALDLIVKREITPFILFKEYLADDESGSLHIDHAMAGLVMYRKNLVDGMLREVPTCSRAH